MKAKIISQNKFKYIDEGSGIPIILLHGLMGSLSNFKSCVEELPKKEEFFMWSIKTEIQQALNKYLMINKLQSKVLTRDDKLKVISYMKNKGYISKKGAKTIISELLAISRPTLYKYLKEI